MIAPTEIAATTTRDFIDVDIYFLPSGLAVTYSLPSLAPSRRAGWVSCPIHPVHKWFKLRCSDLKIPPSTLRKRIWQADIESRVPQGDVQMVSQPAVAAAFVEVR